MLSICAAMSMIPMRASAGADARFVYIGTYTAPNTAPGGEEPSKAEGIYVTQMDPYTGNLTPIQVVSASNPSYLALDASLTHLYSVNEDDEGRLSAYTVDPASGTLTFLNSVSAGGSATTHLSVHPSGRYVLAANYTSGNAPVVRLAADGSLGALTDLFQSVGNGAGPNPDNQDAPHAHQFITDPSAGHVFLVDLGSDKLNALTLDLDTGKLAPGEVPFVTLASGSGPRHAAFHPDPSLPRLYVLDEMLSTITVFKYDPVRGAAIWLQTISTLPESFTGDSSTAEIRIHPSGRFLYSTNRGHESVALFAIDATSGKLESIGWQSTGGREPRGMNIDPSGTFLYVANQNTNDIGVYKIHRSGQLQETARVALPTPVDIAFGPMVPGESK
jgi:6-phosphogluconolactonase